MKLFWVTTLDHDEDWFIFADSDGRASKLHEEYEGYDSNEATAKLVCYVPIDINVIEGWPQPGDLEKLGATFLNIETPRKVEIAGSVYIEGGLDALIEMSVKIKH